jgi:hypothetical protein
MACAVIVPCLAVHDDHDFTTIALRVVEQAIGEKWDESPLLDKDKGKNPAAVALGKLGGAKGGVARAAALSPRKRKMIAKKRHWRAGAAIGNFPQPNQKENTTNFSERFSCINAKPVLRITCGRLRK